MVSGSLPCFGSASTTPNPSTSGIWMSRKARSGFSRLIRAIADLPSPHSATTSKSGSSSSSLRRRSRASDSSSLSNTRMGIDVTNLLRTFAKGYVYLDDAPPGGSVLNRHLVIVVVELLQARARVLQPNAFLGHRSSITGESQSVVAYLHPQLVEDLARRYANEAGSAPRANAVANGIFHQRLQEKVRNQGGQRVGLDVHLHPQPVLEAGLLNINVLLQECQLAAERRFVDAHGIQRETQQIGQLQRHVLGSKSVVARQCGDGIQGIKQKVRLKLDLQYLKLGMGQLCFQL